MKAINFEDVQTNMMIVPYIMCFIGILCLATPIRKKLKAFWDNCLKSDAEEMEGVTYASKSMQFTDCYDISNPLTYKDGKSRLLNAQIEQLEKEGKSDEAEMLKN